MSYVEILQHLAPVPDRANVASRLPTLYDVAVHPADTMRFTKAVVVGAGSIGGAAALHMARHGAGEIRVIDRGFYKPESLLTHAILPEDLGKPKAETLARACKAIHPGGRFRYYQGSFQELGARALIGADIVLLATDNLAVEVAVGEACKVLGVPLVQGSVQGNLLSAQVRVFGTAADGPCPLCAFGSRERQMLAEETAFSCSGHGDPAMQVGGNTPATRSPAALCASAASWMVLHGLLVLLEDSRAPRDSLVGLNAFANRTTVTPLTRRPDCPGEHARWHTARFPGDLHRATLNDLLEFVAQHGMHACESLRLEQHFFAREAVCACPKRPLLGRFVAESRTAGRCRRCGEELAVPPYFAHRDVPLSLLTPHRHRSLHDLGASHATSVLLRGPTPLFLHAGIECDANPESVTDTAPISEPATVPDPETHP